MKRTFDFFISYASEDAYGIIAPMATALKKRKLTYFLDLEQIDPGANVVHGINVGYSRSKYILAIITANSIKKPWAMIELQTVLHEQISSGENKLIPIIAGTPRQKKQIMDAIPLLRSLHYLEWNHNPYEISRLLYKKISA